MVIEYAIHEKDFLMAGESASKTKKALQQLGLKAEAVKNTAIIVYEAAMNVSNSCESWAAQVGYRA